LQNTCLNSDDTEQRERDYVAKRIQYQDRGIPEYWIVDPQRSAILVLVLKGDRYLEWRVVGSGDGIASLQYGELNCTVEQVFAAAE
jgi:Uma2 family endonuclease